ncbi:protein held out wings isoform X1 [Cimex lectularius]|uniref:K Homology domain-containing protein n=1 Tax=Cimex lectularius TaxID=79782 RepID=A0A8I6SGH6_CIMLE|nr:protein held out wings isoform X1 [Cimex lectularius]XP_024080887.1 protein held out wings isoform X1 [Cimex lectularius]
MSDHSVNSTQSIADYLAQLLKDRKQVTAFPNVFMHVERLIDEEIGRVRSSLFQVDGVKKEPLVLPEPEGETTTLMEKVFVPVKDHPDFNFVGRILGPRGMTAKQLELETGCKIMVRGKGSMRDKKKEEASRGKPNWEHLSEDLHVLITVEDTENRAKVRLARAVEEVKNLIIPAEGEDELKKRQLMELAIINGTYRDSNTKALAAAGFSFHETWPVCCERELYKIDYYKDEEWRRMALAAAAAAAAETQRLMSPGLPGLGSPLRTQSAATAGPLGAPLILSPRLPVPTSAAPLLSPPEAHPHHQLIYTPYASAAQAAADYSNYAALAAGSPLISEYAAADHSGAAAVAAVAKQRRHLGQIREHPYQRAGALS